MKLFTETDNLIVYLLWVLCTMCMKGTHMGLVVPVRPHVSAPEQLDRLNLSYAVYMPFEGTANSLPYDLTQYQHDGHMNS